MSRPALGRRARASSRTNASTSSCDGTLPPTRLRNSTGRDAVQRQLHVFDHLTVAHFNHDKDASAECQPLELHHWKWIERDGPQHADLDAGGAGLGGDGLQDAAHDAVANQHDLGVVGHTTLRRGSRAARRSCTWLRARERASPSSSTSRCKRRDEIAARRGRSGHGPLGQMRRRRGLRKFDRLHHLADESVGHHHHRVAITVGQIEGQRGQVRHLLHGVRRQHDGAVVAVAAALHHLVVVALLGGNVAQAGPAARNVGDDAGQFRAGHVADAFLHQADAGAARCRHGAHARRRCAVKHIDGRDFALRLHVDAAGFRHELRRRLGDLAGRRNGIAVECAASGQNGALDDGFVALHQLLAHAIAPSAAAFAARASIRARSAGGKP